MFAIRFTKTVWDSASHQQASEMAILVRDDELPCPPSVSVEYFWPLLMPERPKAVRWDFDQRRFDCAMPDEHQGDGIDDYDFDELLEHLISGGWKLVNRKPWQWPT
ncbi:MULTISPECIES: hypothetical protein [unclassified Janthinobacterium]|uniref:hypothetical protein n=1 Tax=unclassified Janthinobacterium TaxID=2610881 RepID=UPI0012FC88B4|nr:MULTISPECIES: hypothetical protein [unclassified Janthinobacterium]MEC5159581.1 hypothetical protein [Janthinobacterium sp. CG_S6]